MRRLLSRSSVVGVFAFFSTFVPMLCAAQTVAAVERSARVLTPVNAGQTVRLSGHVPAYADTTKLPSTALAPSVKFAHVTMVLSRSADVEAAFDQLLADQVNPSSPRYHQWLTPAQVGTLYGPAQSDVDAVTAWLQSQGLTVNSVSPNRLFVDFGGPLALVESAFSTSFRTFSLPNGEQRYSLIQEPSVPAAIQPVIKTIAGLSQSIHYPSLQHSALKTVESVRAGERPQYTFPSTSGTEYFLMSGDFAVAYDINSVYGAGITGSGQHIAVIGESRVDTTDISTLQSLEGVPTDQANVIIPTTGVDPGTPGDTSGKDNEAQDEATLDVNRTTGTAPGATVDLVVSGDVNGGATVATDGLYIAINYEISTVNDPIMSISFGGCEAVNGSALTQYEASLFQTAASQGITTFVSSGDQGAAGCYGLGMTADNYVASINDLCASGYVTCMGGTEFAAFTDSATYWSGSNATYYISLLSYPPEGAWNDVSLSSGAYSFVSSGGGASVYVARPSWQTGTGVISGSTRVVPDLALASSPNNGFVTCLKYLGATCGLSSGYITAFYSFGGTSAAAPSMAGIQALVNQKLGGRQGNVNPVIYGLGGNLSNAFHDVTLASSGVGTCSVSTPSLCNNSVPSSTSLSGGLAGYQVGAGWDAVTGWGSVDVAKYLTAVTTSSFTVSPAATSLALTPTAGASTTDVISVQSIDGFNGTVGLMCNVTGTGATGTCSLSSSSVSLTSGTNSTVTLTVTNTGTTSGTLSVVVTGTSGSLSTTSPAIAVAVAPLTPSFTVAAASTLSFTSGATSGNSTSVTLASVNGFAGTVALSCSLSTSSAAYQPSCAISPTSVSLTSGSTNAATLTITSTTARSAAQSGGLVTAAGGWSLGGGTALALLLFCTPLRKRRKAFSAVMAAGLLAFGLGLSGCSGGGGTTVIPTMKSSAGTYTATITGTPAAGASSSAQVSTVVTVTIN